MAFTIANIGLIHRIQNSVDSPNGCDIVLLIRLKDWGATRKQVDRVYRDVCVVRGELTWA